MSYIGRSPQIGAYSKLDQITTDGSASYTMQLNSANFVPESVNHLIVSVNGVIQAPTDSFTVSGSTITFASSLSVSDTIDFIMALGNVLDIGVPSDSTVSLSKLTASGTKDATTFLRGDNTFAVPSGGENTPAFYGELPSDQVVSRNVSTKLTGMTQNEIDTDNAFDGTTFTVPSGKAGKYYIYAHVLGNFSDCGNDGEKIVINIFKNGSSVKTSDYNSAVNNQIISFGVFVSMTLDLSVSDTIEAYTTLTDASANTGMKANDNHTYLGGYKLIGV